MENIAWEALKKALFNAPVLRSDEPNIPFEISADASQTGVGAVLSQTDDTGCRPVAFTSTK